MEALRAFVGSSLFFFNDTATTEIYTLSLHDALPISEHRQYRPLAVVARGPCKDDRKPREREAQGRRLYGLLLRTPGRSGSGLCQQASRDLPPAGAGERRSERAAPRRSARAASNQIDAPGGRERAQRRQEARREFHQGGERGAADTLHPRRAARQTRQASP